MFYIIEKVEQLERIRGMDEGFVEIIPYNYNFHPKLQKDKVSLVYVRSFSEYEKGYILCVKHNESLSLPWEIVHNFLKEKIKKVFVLDKKKFLYFVQREEVNDLNFVEILKGESVIENPENKTISYFYKKSPNYPELNCIVPISKHFEQKEAIFKIIQEKQLQKDPLFQSPEFQINNGGVTEVFFGIENEGIELNRDDFVNHFGNMEYPEFNINQSIIYTHYNLYTATGRPSNTFNEINFAALNKTNGERNSFKAREGCTLIEFDINGMHPRIIGGMVGFPLPRDQNVYDFLQVKKEEVFHNIYGGVKKEYQTKPFFKEIHEYTERLWKLSEGGSHVKYFKSILRIFHRYDFTNPSKLFNYIIQSRETFFNISTITLINNYLKINNKKSRIILTTYDSYLLNYDESDGVECLVKIKEILPKSKVTAGKCYGRMEQYEF